MHCIYIIKIVGSQKILKIKDTVSFIGFAGKKKRKKKYFEIKFYDGVLVGTHRKRKKKKNIIVSFFVLSLNLS